MPVLVESLPYCFISALDIKIGNTSAHFSRLRRLDRKAFRLSSSVFGPSRFTRGVLLLCMCRYCGGLPFQVEGIRPNFLPAYIARKCKAGWLSSCTSYLIIQNLFVQRSSAPINILTVASFGSVGCACGSILTRNSGGFFALANTNTRANQVDANGDEEIISR